MKSINLGKTVMATAVGAVLAIGVASNAVAAPAFTIDPTVIPLAGAGIGIFDARAVFVADQISGSSTELLHNTTGNLALCPAGQQCLGGTGWLKIDAFTNGATTVTGPVSGINSAPLSGYQLYLDFFVNAVLVSGVLGAPGSTYTVNVLNFNVIADPNRDNVFSVANATGAVEASSGTAGQKGNDILLALGGLISGVADINLQGGAAINTVEFMAVCDGVNSANVGGTAIAAPGCSPLGDDYFKAPVPFYSVALDAFNNVVSGVNNQLATNGTISIRDAVGKITFVGEVPEPTSVALLGLGLAGLGFSARRSGKQSAA